MAKLFDKRLRKDDASGSTESWRTNKPAEYFDRIMRLKIAKRQHDLDYRD